MSPQQPRRPASSRGVTPRPRKIAGRAPDPVDPGEPREPREPAVPIEPGSAVGTAAPADVPTEGVVPDRSVEDAPAGAPTPTLAEPKASMFAGAGLTRVLVIGLAVVLGLLVLQGVWLVQHELRKDDNGPQVAAGQIQVPAGRPVVLDQTDVDAAVDQAAKDAVVLVRRNYKTYDADVAKAVDLLTDRFSVSYKATSADTKSSILADKVDVDAKVVAQGVVRANSTQVQALLFLNQYVTKGIGKKRRITYTPFKMLLTMIHTDHGWLVDNIGLK